MPDYDPSQDEDTKIISMPPGAPAETSIETTSKSGVVILPDGTRPVSMGSGVVTGILGEGGMAIVYEIWNEQLGVKRAVKLLRPNSSQENKERFEKEIKVTAQLDHPNIIDIHAVGEWNSLPYIEMEMIDGISLSELIKRQGALPLDVCVSIAIIVCRGLSYTHHHKYTVNNTPYEGLLHRDLKPGNILLSREGVVRLTDFGVATPTNVAPSSSSGKIIGSMQYLAPEQMEEDDVDTRADIFSFGCILYEMLTGEKTFSEQNITRLVRKRLKNEYRPISAFNIPVPPKLDHLVRHCLQLNVNKRPADINIILHELEKIHNSVTLRDPEGIVTDYARGENIEEDVFLTGKKLPSRKIAGVALVAFSLVAFGVYIFTQLSRFREQSSEIIEDRGTGTVTVEVEDTKLSTTPPEEAVPEPEETGQPELEQTLARNTETTPVRKKKVALARRIRKDTRETNRKSVTSPREEVSEFVSDVAVTKKGTSPLLATLQRKYKTKDVITIMKAEDAAKNYSSVLEIYKSLPRSLASKKETRLLKHRALVGTNKVNKSYFDNNHINDGEFYLSKAQFLYRIKQYQRAIWILGIIKTSPTVLINKKVLHKEVIYYRALCNTGIFDINPTAERQKTAMQNWFEVKSRLRNSQSHPYFIEANNEIRRISKQKIE